MSRLPTPGGDDNAWGAILNDFLSQEHNADGSQKTLGISKGGTAGTTAAQARTNLGAVADNDSRLSDNRTPTAHASSHAPAGSDPIIPRVLLPTFTKNGVLFADAGTLRLPIDTNYNIVGVRLMAGTAPTGAGIIIDVNKNGSTIFTTQGNRPSIAASANAGGPGTVPNITALAAGDYLTVDIDQVGSATPGSDLVVSIIVDRTG